VRRIEMMRAIASVFFGSLLLAALLHLVPACGDNETGEDPDIRCADCPDLPPRPWGADAAPPAPPDAATADAWEPCVEDCPWWACTVECPADHWCLAATCLPIYPPDAGAPDGGPCDGRSGLGCCVSICESEGRSGCEDICRDLLRN